MVKEFIQYKDRGWNNEKIGDKFGVSDTTVFKYIKRWRDTLK
jgi:transposase